MLSVQMVEERRTEHARDISPFQPYQLNSSPAQQLTGLSAHRLNSSPGAT